MDKKAKKRVEVIRKKITQLQVLLTAAKEQPDDPEEPTRLQAEIEGLQAEAKKLKES